MSPIRGAEAELHRGRFLIDIADTDGTLADRLVASRRKRKGIQTEEHNALSHITRDILQQCSEEFRPGPSP